MIINLGFTNKDSIRLRYTLLFPTVGQNDLRHVSQRILEKVKASSYNDLALLTIFPHIREEQSNFLNTLAQKFGDQSKVNASINGRFASPDRLVFVSS